MLHFKPIKNRVVGLEFCYYFAALCALQLVFLVFTENALYGETLRQFWPLFAILAFGIGLKKAESNHADIEIHETYVIGPSAFSLLSFDKAPVKIDYFQIQALMKGSSLDSLLSKQILKLGDTNGKHIRIITMLYDQKLFEALKVKLGESHMAEN